MFKQNRCKICGYKVSSKWNYCPNCGSNLKGKNRVGPIFNFFGLFEDVLDLFNFENNDSNNYRNNYQLKYRHYTKAIEPKTKNKRIGGKQIIEIHLPDVKREEDIEITQFEQSYEVRAYAGTKMYFKIIPTENDAQIIYKKFENGILKLEIS